MFAGTLHADGVIIRMMAARRQGHGIIKTARVISPSMNEGEHEVRRSTINYSYQSVPTALGREWTGTRRLIGAGAGHQEN